MKAIIFTFIAMSISASAYAKPIAECYAYIGDFDTGPVTPVGDDLKFDEPGCKDSSYGQIDFNVCVSNIDGHVAFYYQSATQIITASTVQAYENAFSVTCFRAPLLVFKTLATVASLDSKG